MSEEHSHSHISKPRVSDTIRIAPVRRSTITPDAWGFHSVPGVLSDFQRQTSQSIQLNNKDSLPQLCNTVSFADWIVSLITFVAFPTALVALSNATAAHWMYSGVVAGPAICLAVTFTELPLRDIVVGLLCLVGSTMIISKDDSTSRSGSISLLSSLAVAALPSSLKTAKSLLQWIWLSFVIGLVTYLSGSIWCAPLLAGTVWSQFANSRKPKPRKQHEFLAGYICGAVMAFGTIFVLLLSGHALSLHALLSCLISTGSFTVFFLLSENIISSRFNCLAAGILAVSVEAAVHGHIGFSHVFELTAVVPSLVTDFDSSHKESELENHEMSLSKKRSSMSWTILDSILAHDDTRSIFYFFVLNFSFMLIQLLYSVLSHSLGLLSDSIHMFFDCLALLVGLLASILSKFPPSSRFPFGLAMVETVSGFANGCMLLVISVGVLFEAMERISNPVELEKVTELIIVSTLGLLVNLVGIFAFSHGHGHSHGGSSHGHSHGHAHSHSESRSDHSHSHSDHSHSHSDHSHSDHSDSDEKNETIPSLSEGTSENLQGILLHIMADTLGSVGVIISTLLLQWTGWNGWDAVASIAISALIFMSAIPLVKSSARSLLLGLKHTEEYKLRDLLNDIYHIDGVSSYTVPKFWDDGQGIRGTIHIQYKQSANSSMVREKVSRTLKSGGVQQFVIQMEEQGATCWCQSR